MVFLLAITAAIEEGSDYQWYCTLAGIGLVMILLAASLKFRAWYFMKWKPIWSNAITGLIFPNMGFVEFVWLHGWCEWVYCRFGGERWSWWVRVDMMREDGDNKSVYVMSICFVVGLGELIIWCCTNLIEYGINNNLKWTPYSVIEPSNESPW